MSPQRPRHEVLHEFSSSPDSALFDQQVVATVLDVSAASLERARWAGGGIPFRRIGRHVRYTKADVMAFLDACPLRGSTTNAGRIER